MSINTSTECCICFEEIGKTNNCTTPCGHSFCLQCLMKSLSRNGTCPMCRSTVIEEEEEEEDLDSEYSNEDDEDDDEYEDDDDTTNLATSDIISIRLQEKGYTMADIVSIYIRRYKRNDPLKESDEFIEQTFKDFDDIIEMSDREVEDLHMDRINRHMDRINMLEEDHRRERHRRNNITAISLMDTAIKTDEDNILGNLLQHSTEI